MRFSLVVIAALVALVTAAPPKWHQLTGYTFEQYVADYRKPHMKGSDEYAMREKLFNARLAEVMAFNAQPASYKKGINHLSDWTDVERKRLNGRIPDTKAQLTSAAFEVSAPAGFQAPLSVDYTKSYPPILTAVKDQGQCGSCWAHAATESIESQFAIKSEGELFVLSQQQITSCTPNPDQCGGTGGCAGATAELAFDYVKSAGGITEEWMYSYTSYFGDSGVCSWNSTLQTPFVNVTGYARATRNNDSAVAASLTLNGPQAISVDASHWFEYESGVYNGCNYSNNISMDHAVQLVGYGHDAALNLDYWLVRNSWSASFGEEGFIRLIRDNECGTNVDWITGGGGCIGENNTVWACGQCGILYDVVYPLVA
ncbi:cysteine peptidase, putative [Bodo saltans]|uniref:Cysteine peptidase, putative n=1 Tax=Bodo saltans TaxID=75058 RepID=A0A0S4JPQ2_BODSA|nr:cysteine peptidase, putative [Bodo saltans]|eukprot:CUG91360.1 cysteine peptidase, putative [Bodo saltans]